MVTRGQAVARTTTWNNVVVMPPTAKDAPATPPYFEFPTQSVVLRITEDVVDRLEKEAIDSFKSITKRGSEIGGLLLGRIDLSESAVTITDYELFECGYTRGPLYLLSDQERRRLELAVRRQKGQEQTVVGYFRSNTRKDLTFDEDDGAVTEDLFSGNEKAVLLIKPFSMKPSTATFFVWQNGRFVEAEGATELPFRRSELAKLQEARQEEKRREDPPAPVRLAPKRPEQMTPPTVAVRTTLPAEPPKPPAAPPPRPVQETVRVVVEPPRTVVEPPAPVVETPLARPAAPPPKVEAPVPQRPPVSRRQEAPPRPNLPVKPLVAQPFTSSQPEVRPRLGGSLPKLPPRPSLPTRPAMRAARPVEPVLPEPRIEAPIPPPPPPPPVAPPLPRAEELPPPIAAAPIVEEPAVEEPEESTPAPDDVRLLFASARMASIERAKADPAPPPPSRMRRWIKFTALPLGLILGGVMAGVYVEWTAKPLATVSGTAGSILSLSVERSGGQFRLTWNRHARAIRTAQKADLVINDAGQSLTVPLDMAELHNGVFSYTPNSTDVVFRLDLTDATEGRTISESIHSGVSRPSAFGNGAPPVKPEVQPPPPAATAPAPSPTKPADSQTAPKPAAKEGTQPSSSASETAGETEPLQASAPPVTAPTGQE